MYTKTPHQDSGGWPVDMLLRLGVGPDPILRLLFVGHVRELPTALALPPMSGVPARDRPTDYQDDSWDSEWHATWIRVSREERQLSSGRIPAMVPASSGFELDAAEEADFTSWRAGLADPAGELFEDQRERAVLAALVPAWQAGLRSIFILPLSGEYMLRLDDQCVVVSEAVRDDDARYSAALASWRDRR